MGHGEGICKPRNTGGACYPTAGEDAILSLSGGITSALVSLGVPSVLYVALQWMIFLLVFLRTYMVLSVLHDQSQIKEVGDTLCGCICVIVTHRIPRNQPLKRCKIFSLSLMLQVSDDFPPYFHYLNRLICTTFFCRTCEIWGLLLSFHSHEILLLLAEVQRYAFSVRFSLQGEGTAEGEARFCHLLWCYVLDLLNGGFNIFGAASHLY